MKETVCQFGSDCGLVGILTQPSISTQFNGPVVVLLSAGLLHRAGPFRLYVSLARALAKVGVSSLRFDLSGIGDSDVSQLTASIEERTLADISTAYDYLQDRHGIDRFVVGGLCSGADDAFRTCTHDERVVGSFQLDGMGYRTKWFYKRLLLDHYLPRLASAEKWKKLIGRFSLTKHEKKPVISIGGEGDLNRSMPSLQQARDGLAKMEANGQKTLLIYTGGVSSYYNYSGQIFDSIPEAKYYKGISEHYLPKNDHTHMLKRDRDDVVAVVCDWMSSSFPMLSTPEESP